MAKMEDNMVEKYPPTFYERYVDDIINHCKKNQVDLLFNDLNNYHQNIKLTLELNQKKVFRLQLRIRKWYLNNIISM